MISNEPTIVKHMTKHLKIVNNYYCLLFIRGKIGVSNSINANEFMCCRKNGIA